VRQGEQDADEQIVCGVWLADLVVGISPTYKDKQLFGANAVEVFVAFHAAFPKATQ